MSNNRRRRTAQNTKKAKANAAKSSSNSAPGQVQLPCGKKEKPKAPQKSKPRKKDCDCVVQKLTVQCSHGRAAKNNLLMVVPEAASTSDPITIKPEFSGGCGGGKLQISVPGVEGFPKKGTNPQKFEAGAPGQVISPRAWIPFLKAQPITKSVSASACGGSASPVVIKIYPNDKLSFKLDLDEWREKLANITALLPINANEAKVTSLKDSGEPNGFEKKQNQGYIQFEGAWKEDQDSHRARCELDIHGGMDPIIGFEGCFLLAGVPIPPMVDQYVKGGLYLSLAGGFGLSLHIKFDYWPDDTTYTYSSTDLEFEGKVDVALAVEMFALSEDVVSAKAGGKAGLSGKLVGEFQSQPKVTAQGSLTKLNASVVFKMCWGLCEYEREWPICDAKESAPYLLLP